MEAEDWSREDWIAIVLSPVAYGLVLIGVARTLLGHAAGVAMVIGAVAVGAIIYWVIDPKLRAVSVEYEARQAGYLEDLERGLRWEGEGFGESGASAGSAARPGPTRQAERVREEET